MRPKLFKEQRGRLVALSALLISAVLLTGLVVYGAGPVLRIRVDATGEVLREVPVTAGDELYVAWLHSQEKIPWHEWYTVEKDGTMTLHTISFPAFGPGIPCDKGVPRIEGGTIYYEQIGEVFFKILPDIIAEIRAMASFTGMRTIADLNRQANFVRNFGKGNRMTDVFNHVDKSSKMSFHSLAQYLQRNPSPSA